MASDASGKSRSDSTQRRSDTGNATYALHRGQVPDPSGNFTKALTATSELACEAACTAEPTCLGFTSGAGGAVYAKICRCVLFELTGFFRFPSHILRAP